MRQAASVGSAWTSFAFCKNSESDCLPLAWRKSAEGQLVNIGKVYSPWSDTAGS